VAAHPEIVTRLRRIEGQVAGVCRMYEDGRYCIELLDQLGAVRAGLGPPPFSSSRITSTDV
jgi:DNA-binding FrmR family transcriptional regulator